jgi:class 3 adenylate cyclase
MHRDLKELLRVAEGESHRVVVVFLDVRGFSGFAKVAESVDSAEFLKSIYLKILEDYFPDATFFKPTGDGLLILLDYDRESLRAVVGSAVAQSIKLVEDFATLTAGDAMINFRVPGDVGIGLSRGSATALVADEKFLDFSGRPLNLASRLMDIARPSGVVFDEMLGPELLDEELASRFSREEIYVKGLAEDQSMVAYCLRDRVVVPEFNRHPLNKRERRTEAPESVTLKQLRARELYDHRLTMLPAPDPRIQLHYTYPDVTGSGRRTGLVTTETATAELVERAGIWLARVDYRPIVAQIEEARVKSTWKVDLTLEYSVKGGS